MALKTQPLPIKPAAIFKALPPLQQAEAIVLQELFEQTTGQVATVWTGNLIGFGAYTYGKPVNTFFRTGFAMRKSGISLYLSCNPEIREALLPELGPHRAGAGCVTIMRLESINTAVLAQLIRASYDSAQNDPRAN